MEKRRFSLPDSTPVKPRLLWRALVPLSAGELVQGRLDWNGSQVGFLVSLPIQRFHTASLYAGLPPERMGRAAGNERHEVLRRHYWKIVQAAVRTGTAEEAAAAAKAEGVAAKAEGAAAQTDAAQAEAAASALEKMIPEIYRVKRAFIRLQGGTLRGKGLATSSADILAVLAVLQRLKSGGMIPAPGLLTRLAVRVEPSDSLAFPGMAAIDYRCGRCWRPLGPAPEWRLLLFDAGGKVDTVSWNGSPAGQDPAPSRRMSAWQEVWSMLIDGFRRRDENQLAQAASLSAKVNQELLPNPLYDTVLRIGTETGAIGLHAAHSGTLLGLIYPAQQAWQDFDEMRRWIGKRYALTTAVARTCNGGVRWRDGC